MKGQFLLVETDFVQLSQFGFGELFLRMGCLPMVTSKVPIYPTLVYVFYSNALVLVGGSSLIVAH